MFILPIIVIVITFTAVNIRIIFNTISYHAYSVYHVPILVAVTVQAETFIIPEVAEVFVGFEESGASVAPETTEVSSTSEVAKVLLASVVAETSAAEASVAPEIAEVFVGPEIAVATEEAKAFVGREVGKASVATELAVAFVGLEEVEASVATEVVELFAGPEEAGSE